MAAKEVICPHCHQPTSAEGAFCGNCGTALATAQPATATTAVPSASAPPVSVSPTHPAATASSASPQPVTAATPTPVDQLNIPSMDSIKEVKTTSWLMIILGGANALFGLYMVTMPQSYIASFASEAGLSPSDAQVYGGVQFLIGAALIVLTILLMRSKSPKKAKSLLIALMSISVVLILLALLGGSPNILAAIALIMAIRSYRVVKKMPQV